MKSLIEDNDDKITRRMNSQMLNGRFFISQNVQ